MISLIALLGLVGLVWFGCEKLPPQVQTALKQTKTLSIEAYKNGKDMPVPVKNYVDTAITPRAKKIKNFIFK